MSSQVWVFFLYDQNADKRDERNIKGFFARDATARTELRFLYLKDETKAICQTKVGKVYVVPKGRKRRKKLPTL